jgi:hypothetical protein
MIEKDMCDMTQAQSIVGYSSNRAQDDYYPTPESATRSLLDREEFAGNVWEPACGSGAMSTVIEKYGHAVISSDLFDRGYGERPIDFLNEWRTVDNIITNPPFLLSEQFVYHALMCSKSKVAMFLKLAFLEGVTRKKMFQTTPLSRVYVFSRRVSLQRNGNEKTGSGMIAFAWFVWEQGYDKEPVIRWI